MKETTPIVFGQRYFIRMPYSEVCVHMQVQGRILAIELVGEHNYPMVQLYIDGSQFSIPILPGEAGIYRSTDGYYSYPADAALRRALAALTEKGHDWSEVYSQMEREQANFAPRDLTEDLGFIYTEISKAFLGGRANADSSLRE